MPRGEDIKKLIINNERRLQKLKEKRALVGVNAAPELLIEIEDTEAEIEKLQIELEGLQDSNLTMLPQKTSPKFTKDTSLARQAPPQIGEDKLKFLYWVYVKTNASLLGTTANADDILRALGLTQSKTIAVAQYLERKGLIEFQTWDIGIKITYEGVVKVESDLFEAGLLREFIAPEEIEKIQQRKQNRFRFLHHLYKKTEGDSFKKVLTSEMASELGLDFHQTVTEIVPYLDEEGLIRIRTANGIAITEEGIERVETGTPYQSLTEQPIQYHSCFISYSSKDEAFAQRLYASLQQNGVRCWFAPEDLKIGERIRVGIDQSIRVHDKLLLILSEHSLASDWVEQEVETAMEQERQRKETVLFPVRLDEAVMRSEVGWAAHLKRTRNIGNFSQWTEPERYQQALQRLLRDLKVDNA